MKKMLVVLSLLVLACTSAAYAYDNNLMGSNNNRNNRNNLMGSQRSIIVKGMPPSTPSGSVEASPVNKNSRGNSQQSLADIVARFGEVTEIRVNKTELTLTLFHGTTPLKSYPVAIGAAGLVDKIKQGDKATPEGTFYLTEKSVLNNDYYLGTRWMRISYPNIEDAWRGYNSGLIDMETRDRIIDAINNHHTPPQNTALGGGIGIHGGSGNNSETQGGFWTFGCIGLKDRDINEIFPFINPETAKLIIEP